MAERRLFLICRNAEREGTIRPFLVRTGELHIAGVYRVADSSGDLKAMVSVSRPDAIYVDSSIPPREAVELATMVRAEFPRTVVMIGIQEKDFDVLQDAIARGIDAVLPEPLSAMEFKTRLEQKIRDKQRSLDYLRAALHQGRGGPGGDGLAPPREPGTTLAFVSSKDGEGKSTVALNLGLTLAQKFGKKVVYIDLDETLSETSMMLNRKPPGTLTNLLAMYEGDYTMEGLSRWAIDYFGDGKFLAICGNMTIEAPAFDRAALELLLVFLRFQVDYVLLDCPVRFSEALRTSLDLADWHLAVVQNTLSSLRNTRIYLQELSRLEYPAQKVRIILNRVSATAGLNKEEIAKSLDPYPVVSNVVSNGPVAINAVSVGVPLVLSAPESDIAQSIQNFAKRLLGIETTEAADHKGGGIGGMFSSLFGSSRSKPPGRP